MHARNFSFYESSYLVSYNRHHCLRKIDSLAALGFRLIVTTHTRGNLALGGNCSSRHCLPLLDVCSFYSSSLGLITICSRLRRIGNSVTRGFAVSGNFLALDTSARTEVTHKYTRLLFDNYVPSLFNLSPDSLQLMYNEMTENSRTWCGCFNHTSTRCLRKNG